VYAILGIAIVRHFMSKSLPLMQVYRYIPFIVLILFFTASFIFPVLMLFIAGLGISDTWLHYRERDRERGRKSADSD
jgi:hypothetical protein